MADDKCKNILMTTMSVLANKRVSYYYFKSGEGDGSRLYCDGISSLEAGTKYFLSQYPIDEILVVGTKETIKEDDPRELTDLFGAWEALSENYNKNQGAFSAFEFYKYRISCFLKEAECGIQADEAVEKLTGKEIDSYRRKELEELLKEECGEENAFFMAREPWNNLKKRIEESIQKGFEDSREYSKYVEKKERLLTYQKEYFENEAQARDYHKYRESIAEDKSLSLMDKEYCYVQLKLKLEESINQNRIINLEAELIELREERDRLLYEINSIREQRRNIEFSYVQYRAYCNISNRLQPKPENVSPLGKGISVRFVDEQVVNGDDNINGIVRALYGDDDKKINLYIDMQGGSRTSGYVRNAVLSILGSQSPARVCIEEIVGTNYNPSYSGGSEIAIETKRYRILDLVSGMNAFIRYGKADMLQNYCEVMGVMDDSRTGRLVKCMTDIDEAISLCDISALVDAVGNLRVLIDGEEGGGSSFVENVFLILRDGIKEDYGRLLEKKEESKEVDCVELISWCNRKGFIQQALTLIEDKMPEEYFSSGILHYKFEDDPNGEKRKRFKEVVEPKYERRMSNKIFYNLLSGVLDAPVFEMLRWIQSEKWGINRKQPNVKMQGQPKNGGKIQLKKEMQKLGYGEADFKVGKKQVEELCKKLKKKADDKTRAEDDEIFTEMYCQFRRMERDYEKKRERNLWDAGSIYDLAKEKITIKGEVPYYSILACCETREYKFDKFKDGTNPLTFRLTLNVGQELQGYKRELEKVFLLHEALKLERNCCNHASEKGIRLSRKVVGKVIEIYVKKLSELRTLCG